VRVAVIAVGRLKAGPARDLFEDYRGRLRPTLELIEVEERRPLSGPELMRREGELLLDALRRRQGKAARPHFFQAVEFAHLGAEDVDDYVAGVDQHPVGLAHAFDAHAAQAGFAQILDHAVGHRADMALRAAGRHHHGVGDRGLSGEIDVDDILGLHVVEAREDDAKRLLGRRPP